MGMYDDLKCSAPLPGTPPAFVGPGHVFQTKDLDCELATYEITADGRLVGPDGAAVPYDGDLEFYDGNVVASWGCPFTANGEDAEWVEYVAQFRDGRLESIREVSHTREPALPRARLSVHDRRPTPEEIAVCKAQRAESLVGRKMYVQMGGCRPGYEVEVVAEGPQEWVVRDGEGKFEVVNRCSRGLTFFASAEEARADQQQRQDEQQGLAEEYRQLVAARKAS